MYTRKIVLIVILVAGVFLDHAIAQENMDELSMIAYWRAEAMVAENDFLYIAAGDKGLRIHNTELDGSPFELGHLDLPGSARDIALQGEIVYIASGWGGLSQIDISDPTTPEETNFYDDHPGEACAIAINGDFAYVGYDSDGLLVFNISDPEAELQPVALLEPEWDVDFLVIADGFLCAADSVRGLYVLDIADPENPAVIGQIDVWQGDILDLAVQGDILVLACSRDGFQAVGIWDPDVPRRIGALDVDGVVAGVSLIGNYAIISDHSHDVIHTISVEDWWNPILVETYDIHTLRADFTIRFGSMVLSLQSGGYEIFGINDQGELDISSIYTLGRGAIDVAAQGETAYVLSDNLTCINISDPEAPTVLGSVEVSGNPAKFAVADDFAYITCNSDGLQIYDINDPLNPTFTGSLTRRYFSPKHVAVQEGIAYVVCNSAVWSIDVSDPEQCEPLGYLEYYGNLFTRSITIADDLAFVPGAYGGLRILDISDPRYMNEVGYILLPDITHAVVVEGDFAYVLAYQGGLHVLDISNPESPIIVGYAESANGRDIAYNDGLVYLACDWAGVRTFDVRDPEVPIEVGYYEGIPGAAYSVAVSDSLVLLTGRHFFSIYQYTAEDDENIRGNGTELPGSVFMQTYPNPFNSTATIRFTLPNRGQVSLGVYNPLGQWISTLFEGYRPAGTYTTNLVANNLPSGLYFANLLVADQMFTQKILLIR